MDNNKYPDTGKAIENAIAVMQEFGVTLEKWAAMNLEPMKKLLDELETTLDERTAARRRSRDDLSKKRKQQRGKNRHILPPK